MFKQMKKLLALVLTVLMLINALPVSALAEVASEWLSIPYSYDDESQGAAQDGGSFTIPVYFYDNVRGKLAERSTSVTVSYSSYGGGSVNLSSSSAITEVLGDLGDYDYAVLADDDDNIASGTAVSSLRVNREGNFNRYTYYLASGSSYNATRLNHEGKNIYVCYDPQNPALSIASEVEISTGESKQVAADLMFASAGEASITWESSDSSVTVTPDSANPTKAVIKGVSPAKDVIITVKAAVPGFNTAAASMRVDVIQGVTGVTIYQNGASVNGNEFTLETGGETLNLSAEAAPSNASDKTITWTSSNPAVASVKGGVVTTGNYTGSATISAVAANGVRASVTVHVHAFKLEVEPAVVNIVEEESFYIYPLISSVSSNWTVTVQPADAGVVQAQWLPNTKEAVITGGTLPEGKESASTTVRFTLTHTVNGVTESKIRDITVNVSPKAADEYYTVSLFDMSGVLISATTVEAGENFILPTASQMNVEGYNFNGFKDLEDPDAAPYTGTVTNVDRNLILMADYTLKKHKVTFVVHQADSAEYGETEIWVDHGDVVDRPADPAPLKSNGYVVTKFIDWHDHHDHTLRNSYDFWSPVTQDITLCAHFEPAAFNVTLSTFAGTYQNYSFTAADTNASVTLPGKTTLDNTSVTLPGGVDIDADDLGGYYTSKEGTDRKWSYFRFWQVGGTNQTYTPGRSGTVLNYNTLRSLAYDAATGEWNDVVINAVYEPDVNANGEYTREYQSLNATIPVRVVTEDGYVLGMGKVFTQVKPSFGVGQGSYYTNGYNTSQVTSKTAKFGTVDLNGLDVTVTDSEGVTATYTIVSGESGNLISNAELVWLCQQENHVYGATSDMAYSYYCSGGCWNVLGIVTVVVRLHQDDLRLRVNYYNIPEGGNKEDAEYMKSLFFGNEEGELEAGDALAYLDYVDGIGQTYSYHSHEWVVGREGAVAQAGSSYVLDIYYTHWPHTVIVHYVDEDGKTVAPDAVRTLHKNTNYFIVSPEIEGYVPDTEIVRGKMPGGNVEITVVYYPVGWLQLEKIVKDKSFNPYGASFAFVAENNARETSVSLLVNSFTRNADGSWSGNDQVQLRTGRYIVMEQNASGDYEVSYSAPYVDVLAENTQDNPAKISVTNTRKLPAVAIAKAVVNQPANGRFFVEGETIQYEITVSNSGKAAANALVVSDDLLNFSTTINLAAGASESFTGSYVVTKADAARGRVVNIATADNADIDEVTARAEAPAGENPNPQHDVAKRVVGKIEGYELGETVHFQLIISNTGNVNLENVHVVDELVKLDNHINLVKGDSHVHDVYYTVTAADIAAGKVENVVTAAYGNHVKRAAATVTTAAANPQITVKKETTNRPADNAPYGLGDIIQYKITVTNTGNVNLSDIAVTDELTGDQWVILSLVPGGSRTFNASYQVKASDLQLRGSEITNTAVAAGKDPSGNDVSSQDSVRDQVMEPVTSWTIDKKIISTPGNAAGYDLNEVISYKITVTNTGNQVIENLRVVDELVGLDRTLIHLAVGESKDIEGELYHRVTSEDIAKGKVVNEVVSTLAGYAPVSDTAEARTVAKVSSFTVDKTVENRKAKYALGEVVQYRITVANTGNQPYTNLKVVDELIGLDTTTNLYVGETKEFTGSYEITEADIQNGFVKNVATVGDQSDTETVETDEARPHFTVHKNITSQPASGTDYKLGEVITYAITIANTGNQTLDKLDVADALLGYTGVVENLAPGKTVVIDQDAGGNPLSYTVNEGDIAAGSVVNVVSVSDGDETKQATAKADTDSPRPHVTIRKEVTNRNPADKAYQLGETITYKVTVINTGNVKLTSLNVKDEMIGLDKVIDLSAGASAAFTGSYVVQEKDVLAGKVVNVATAKKTTSTTEPIRSNEVEVPTEKVNPALEITKSVKNGVTAGYNLGDTVEYIISVKNSGNVTLANIQVSDNRTNDRWTIAKLTPGSTESFTARYAVKANDILAGRVENTAAAAAVYGEENLSASAGAVITTVAQNPSWTITKEVSNRHADGSPFALGEKIAYRITVKNTGNVALNGLQVDDNKINLHRTVNLAINGTVTLTGEYTVTEADILSQGHKVVNVVSSAFGNVIKTAEAEANVAAPAPAVEITKQTTSTPADGAAYQLGEKIHYTVTVINTGNVNVENIRVEDALVGLVDVITLKVGAHEEFAVSYTVTENDIGKGVVENIAAITYAANGEQVRKEAGVTDPVAGVLEGLNIRKIVTSTPANGQAYAEGERITYQITVTNTGNQTRENLLVEDALTKDRWIIETLSPGKSVRYTANYVVLESDVLRGSVLNVAVVEGVEAEVEVKTVEADAAISVDKITVSQPRNGRGYAVGETISYKIVVANTGNLTVKNITVTDPLTLDKWNIETLEPGASRSFDAQHQVFEDEVMAGQVVNTASAVGTAVNNEPVQASDSVADPTDAARPAIQVVKTITNLPANAAGYAVGEEITYGILVTNTGNLRLVRVEVKDDLTGEEWYIEALPRGISKYYTTRYTVTEADLLKGSVLNVVTASGESPDPDQPIVSDQDQASAETVEVNRGLKVAKAETSKPRYTAYRLGETISYKVTVTNTGNITQSVHVKDDKIGLSEENVSLEVGESKSFTGSYTVTQADVDAGKVVNIASANNIPSNEVTVKTEAEKRSWTVEKFVVSEPANGSSYALGETVSYRIAVTNTGNVELKNLAVADDKIGLRDTIALLNIGQSKDFFGSYTVTEADILRGYVENVAAAGGKDSNKVVVVVDQPVRDAAISKITTSRPANGSSYALGEMISYKVTVKNTGNVKLENVEVVDALIGLRKTISLEVGESKDFTGSYVVTEADILAGKVVNVASAMGKTAQVQDPTDAVNRDLKITKTVSGRPANGAAYRLGETVRYQIVVVNTGNVTLNNIPVVDELTADSWIIASLSPGRSSSFTASYVVQEKDILNGRVLNVATAGDEQDTEIVETEDPQPSIRVDKVTVSQPANGRDYAVGETISYRIVVTNAGNLTVKDITVTDPLTLDNWTIASLSPGASRSFDAQHQVFEDEVIAGKVVNTAAAKGTAVNGAQVQASDSVTDPTEDARPAIQVVKTITNTPAKPEGYAAGEEITYQIVVTNTGNLRLMRVEVKDELTGDAWYIEALPRGASKTFTAGYTVTENDLVKGSVLNVVTVKGDSPAPKQPTVSDEDDVQAETEPANPAIQITKTVSSTPANGEAYRLGEVIRYQIVVRNTGNLTARSVNVQDELTGDRWQIEVLAPGQAEIFTAEYTVTEDDLIAGSVLNVATARGTTPGGDPEDEDEIETDVEDSDPELKVVKLVTGTPANGETYRLGEVINYRIVVQNTGNISVFDVEVKDDLTGESWKVESLAPGQAEAFITSYVVTEDDLIAGSVVNTAAGTAAAKDPDEPVVKDDDTVETDVEDSDPAIEVIKTVLNPKAEFKLDEIIEYQIEVKNIGNITISNINVADELTKDAWTIESLAPGASAIFTAKYTVTKADTIERKVLNVAVANGGTEDPEEPTVEDEGEVEVEIAKIVIEKAALGNVVMNVGDCFE